MKRRRDADRVENKKELAERIRKARESGSDFDLDYDEVTDIMDLVTEQTKKVGENCFKKADDQVERIATLRLWPPPAPKTA